MTEVKRKDNESFESLLRRFNNRVQMSGRLIQAKKIKFLAPSENKTKKKSAALKRKQIKEKINYMLKTGKISEEDLNRRGKLKLKKK
ncbi:30S ribosomal protein S21 [Patescibacteria group bacterium]|nr:30S ribosomal protein S21 [Patescibacteria group bacterium]